MSKISRRKLLYLGVGAGCAVVASLGYLTKSSWQSTISEAYDRILVQFFPQHNQAPTQVPGATPLETPTPTLAQSPTSTPETASPTPTIVTQEEQQIRELLTCYADLYSHHNSNILPSLYTDDAILIWKFVDGNTRTLKGTYQIGSFYRDMFIGAQMGLMNFKIGEVKVEENRVKANANCTYSILFENAAYGLISRSSFVLADISSTLDKRRPHILKSGWRIRLEFSEVYRG